MRRAVSIAPTDGLLILAEGEQTGHHHSIAAGPNVALLADGAKMFLKVEGEPAKLRHQEHRTLLAHPGTHEIVHQRRALAGQESRFTTQVWD